MTLRDEASEEGLGGADLLLEAAREMPRLGAALSLEDPETDYFDEVDSSASGETLETSQFDFREELAKSLERERDLREEKETLERKLDAAKALAEHRQKSASLWRRALDKLTTRRVRALPLITVSGRERLTPEQAADLAAALSGIRVPHLWLPLGVEVVYHDKQGNEFALQRGSGMVEQLNVSGLAKTQR